MSSPLIAAVAFAYFVVAVEQFWKGNYYMGFAWLGWAAGNVGMALASK